MTSDKQLDGLFPAPSTPPSALSPMRWPGVNASSAEAATKALKENHVKYHTYFDDFGRHKYFYFSESSTQTRLLTTLPATSRIMSWRFLAWALTRTASNQDTLMRRAIRWLRKCHLKLSPRRTSRIILGTTSMYTAHIMPYHKADVLKVLCSLQEILFRPHR